MSDLFAFLAAVHAADEQAARAATESCGAEEWPTLPETDDVVVRIGKGVVAERVFDPDTSTHIARHDPQSVLARVEAERALVALHRPETRARGIMCAICAEDIEHGSDREGDWPCPTLRALAWGYRHREGFDPAWAPEGVSADA